MARDPDQRGFVLSGAVAYFVDRLNGRGADAWFDRELAGFSLADKRLKQAAPQTGGADGERRGPKHSAGMPRLGRHEGGLSFFLQPSGQRDCSLKT
jgi:hypothetical protein